MFIKVCRHTLAVADEANTCMELRRLTNQELELIQLKRRKCNWLGHTLRRNDDSIARQALQWTCRATEIEDDQRTRGKEIWRMK